MHQIKWPLSILLFWIASIASVHAAEPVSPLGHWKNEDATFEIFDSGGKLSAKIIDLKEPKTPEGETKKDIHNPDATKRSQPIVGMIFMSGFTKKSDTRWENGTIYDPKSGYTYSCFLELEGVDKIKVRGFIGISLIGRTDVWTRADCPLK